VSEVRLSEMVEAGRMDAEYYKKEYFEIYEKLENSPVLGNITKMSDLSTNGSFAQVKEILSKGNKKIIPYIRSSNVGDTFINSDNLEYISFESHMELQKSTTQLHDVMMARKGKIGGASIIRESETNFNCNENTIKLTLTKKEFNPFYLTVFLNSKYGFKQIERLSTGNVQPWASIYQLKQILIYKTGLEFQLQIEEIVRIASDKDNLSKSLYSEAEPLLLRELDLENYEPDSQNIAEVSLSQMLQTGRMDAEYFQPKYAKFVKHLQNYKNGCETLGELVKNYSTGYPFSTNDYIENGDLSLIRINNIKNAQLDLSNAVFLPETHKQISTKDIAKENDILISMSGSIGLSCKIDKNINVMVNQRILKIKTQHFNPDILVLILNSIIARMQLKRIGTGGVQVNISASDILKIQIPLIPQTLQTQIAQKVQQSHALRKESKRLLEVAKKAVEIAIEQDEQTAINWIEKQSEW